MASTRRTSGHYPGRLVYPIDLDASLRKHRYTFWKPCNRIGLLNIAGALTALPVANATDVDTGYLPEGIPFQVYQRTAQAALQGAFTTAHGLQIQGDVDADNEGLEYCWGGVMAENPFAHTSGTTLGSFYRIRLEVEDVSGLDNTFIGWRINEAFAAGPVFANAGDPAYTDLAGIGFMSATGGQVLTLSDLNNSGSAVATDTGFDIADGGVIEFETRIIGQRIQYFINGARVAGGQTIAKDGAGTAITAQTLTTQPTFDFDSGDVLLPVISVQQATHQSIVYLRELEIGRLVAVGKDRNALA